MPTILLLLHFTSVLYFPLYFHIKASLLVLMILMIIMISIINIVCDARTRFQCWRSYMCAMAWVWMVVKVLLTHSVLAKRKQYAKKAFKWADEVVKEHSSCGRKQLLNNKQKVHANTTKCIQMYIDVCIRATTVVLKFIDAGRWHYFKQLNSAF